MLSQHELEYLRSLPESELCQESRLLLAKADCQELRDRDDHHFSGVDIARQRDWSMTR